MTIFIYLSIYLSSIFMHMCFACIHVCVRLCAWCLWRPEERALDPIGLELQAVVNITCTCGCWQSNLDPLEEQPVLFNHWANFPAPFFSFSSLAHKFIAVFVCLSTQIFVSFDSLWVSGDSSHFKKMCFLDLVKPATPDDPPRSWKRY